MCVHACVGVCECMGGLSLTCVHVRNIFINRSYYENLNVPTVT